MRRRIIEINADLCVGCGLCVTACHEGAIGLENGKAKLLRDDYCDGLGDCLPACPVNAITFVEREAAPYDPVAVEQAQKMKNAPNCLKNFPVQLKLVPENGPFFRDADLLIAADCTAYAYGNFHRDFMTDKITLVGCPKLDGVDYSQKLSRIFAENSIRSITVVRMTVPCCGGLPFAVKNAVAQSGKDIPVTVITIDPHGNIA